MARHRQPPLADCRHGIDHPHYHARHETGRACNEKVCRSIELIIFVPLRSKTSIHGRHQPNKTMGNKPMDFRRAAWHFPLGACRAQRPDAGHARV